MSYYENSNSMHIWYQYSKPFKKTFLLNMVNVHVDLV